MSTARRLPRSRSRNHSRNRARLRVFVLLLALLLPGEAYAAPVMSVTAESIVEYDAVDPLPRTVTRAAVPQRPAAPPDRTPPPAAAEAAAFAPVPPRAPQALHALCSVVLRC